MYKKWMPWRFVVALPTFLNSNVNYNSNVTNPQTFRVFKRNLKSYNDFPQYPIVILINIILVPVYQNKKCHKLTSGGERSVLRVPT